MASSCRKHENRKAGQILKDVIVQRPRCVYKQPPKVFQLQIDFDIDEKVWISSARGL